jgi:hypothetical protein
MRTNVVSHNFVAFAKGKESEHVPQQEEDRAARYAVRACRRLQDRRGRSHHEAPVVGARVRLWKRECVCSYETWQEPTPSRVRLDPLDPKTAGHMGACECKAATEPDVIKVLLRITEKDGYWWVECAGCEGGWQVPFYAQERVG